MHHHFEVAVFIPGKAGFITHGSEAWSGKEMTTEFMNLVLLALQQRYVLKVRQVRDNFQ